MDIRVVSHDSPEYWRTIELRRRILRWPLGLDFSDADLAAEARETHIAAFERGELVGCLVMVPQNCSVVKMRQVAVEPEKQGFGVGSQMVRFSEEWARSQGYTRIELHARDTAVAFYLRLDYRLDGEPFEEVTIPHRAMSKDIADKPSR